MSLNISSELRKKGFSRHKNEKEIRDLNFNSICQTPTKIPLTLVSSADNICKQFGPIFCISEIIFRKK